MFNRKRKREEVAESPIYDLEARVLPKGNPAENDEVTNRLSDETESEIAEAVEADAENPEATEGIKTEAEEMPDANDETGDVEAETLKNLDENEEKTENETAMMQAFEAWLEDSIPDSERREVVREAMGLVHGAMTGGDFDDAIFDVIAKGADYDRAIAEAAELGEARGFEAGEAKGREEGAVDARNAEIDRYFEEAKGDGVPHPGTGSTRGSSRGFSIFDLARNAL